MPGMAKSKTSSPAHPIVERGPAARRGILLAMVGAIPLAVMLSANNPVNVPKLTLLMMGTTAVAAIRVAEITQGTSAAGLWRLKIPALAIFVPLLVSWIVNPYRGWTLLGEYGRFQGLIPTLTFIVFGALIADAFSEDVRPLTRVVAGVTGVVGVLAIIQKLGVDPFAGYTGWARSEGAIGTFGNTNFTGGFLAIGLPVAVAVAWSERSRRKLAWAIVAAAVGGLLASVSQGAWAAGLAGVAVLAGFHFSRHRFAKAAGFALAGLIALTLVLSVIFAARLGVGTGKVRQELWRAAAAMGAESPIVGHGPNAFGYKSALYRGPTSLLVRDGDLYADEPHSVLMASWANTGLLGLAGFLIAIGWVTRRAGPTAGSNLAGAGLLAGLVAYLIQSLVSIDEVSIRLLLWTLLGAFVAAGVAPVREGAKKAAGRARPARARRRSRPLRQPAVVGLIAVAAAGLFFWQANFLLADIRFRRAMGHVGGSTGLSLSLVDQALGFRDEYEYRHVFGFSLAQVAINTEGGDEELIRESEEMFAFVPEFPDVTATLDKGRVLAAWARFDESYADKGADVLLQAAEMDPYSVEIRVSGAAALRQAGRDEEAEELLTSFLELNPRSAPAWAELAIQRAETGDVRGAEEALAEATSLDPDLASVEHAREFIEESD
jgi:O-antigen ligase